MLWLVSSVSLQSAGLKRPLAQRGRGIEWVELSHPDTGLCAQRLQREAIEQEAVVVTDSEAAVELAKGIGLPCIGIEAGADRLSAPFIVEEVQQIDEDILELAHCRFYGLPLVIAETPRLRIRELVEADFLSVLEWAAKADDTFCEALTAQHLQRQIDTVYPLFGFGIWLIESREEQGRPIGLVGFSAEEVPAIGFYVCERWRRRRIAFEACEAALAYLRELGYCRIDCRIAKGNPASQDLAEKLGFIRCTEQTDAAIYDYSMTSITV